MSIYTLTPPDFYNIGSQVVSTSGSVGQYLVDGVKYIVSKIIEAVQTVFRTLAELPKDTGTHAGIARKLEKYIIPVASGYASNLDLTTTVAGLKALKGPLCDVADVLEWIRTIISFDYFVSGRYHNDSNLGAYAQAAGFVADITGALYFMGDVNVIDLDAASSNVSTLAPSTLSTISFRAGVVCHGLTFLDTLEKVKAAQHKALAPVSGAADVDAKIVKKLGKAKFDDLTPALQAIAKNNEVAARAQEVTAQRVRLAAYTADLALDALSIMGSQNLHYYALVSTIGVGFTIASTLNQPRSI